LTVFLLWKRDSVCEKKNRNLLEKGRLASTICWLLGLSMV